LINNSNLHIIITLSLVIALIAIIIFGPTNESNEYENELNFLKQNNNLLIIQNDSVLSLNVGLQKEINYNLSLIDSTTKVIEESKKEIDYLNKKRNEIPDIINSLNSDGITTALSSYIKRRS
tara:strand:- start:2207 stop:2572 length:366 start_codon:yes stop_codon:yes gene_type:complete